MKRLLTLVLSLTFVGFLHACGQAGDAPAVELGDVEIYATESPNALSAVPTISATDAGKIRFLVSDLFDLASANSEYHRASVKVDTDHLVVYLMPKNSWSVDTVKLSVNADLELTGVEFDYIEPAAVSAPVTRAACPDPTIEAVVSTMETGISTAVEAVNYVAGITAAAGFTTKKLLGSAESLTAIKNWLECPNLKFWGRVGHGMTSYLVLSGGNLSYTYFQTKPVTFLNGTVVYANSCQSHNPPFEPAIVRVGVQKFIAGNVNLLIGPSEKVFKCWAGSAVRQRLGMTSSLTSCERSTRYPQIGAHGISGNGSDTFPAP